MSHKKTSLTANIPLELVQKILYLVRRDHANRLEKLKRQAHELLTKRKNLHAAALRKKTEEHEAHVNGWELKIEHYIEALNKCKASPRLIAKVMHGGPLSEYACYFYMNDYEQRDLHAIWKELDHDQKLEFGEAWNKFADDLEDKFTMMVQAFLWRNKK